MDQTPLTITQPQEWLGVPCQKLQNNQSELIGDIDMLLMIEKAKRGGISQVCSKRYAKAKINIFPTMMIKRQFLLDVL